MQLEGVAPPASRDAESASLGCVRFGVFRDYGGIGFVDFRFGRKSTKAD
jgi:hypothetical protein